MSKLYTVNLIVVKPENIQKNNSITKFESEHIIVKKTPFGYQEVFTKHILKPKKVIEKNTASSNNLYPFLIVDEEISENLKNNKLQFFIDTERLFIRETDPKDAKDYIEDFEKSTINKYYKEKEQERKIKRTQKKEEKRSSQRTKKLIKEHKKTLNK